jgi:hypothetical protein
LAGAYPVVVTTAYAAGFWTDFAVATAGTAATLSGLLFVAVSINLQRILEFPSLPTRAGQTLILFATPLLVGLLLLVPGQPAAALASELIVAGLAIGGYQLFMDARSVRAEQETPVTRAVAHVLPPVVSCGCMVIAGSTLIAGAGGGLYWLVPSVLAAVIFGLINAWVLLVEILR